MRESEPLYGVNTGFGSLATVRIDDDDLRQVQQNLILSHASGVGDPLPVEVVRGYDLPAWVGPSTLVIASSYSGTTEETISAFGQAAERKAPAAIISTGACIPARAA